MQWCVAFSRDGQVTACFGIFETFEEAEAWIAARALSRGCTEQIIGFIKR